MTKIPNRFLLRPFRAAALGFALCIHAGTCAFAQTTHHVEADPGDIHTGYTGYVGHFGETFRVPEAWNIRGAMHGDIEVINVSSRYRPLTVEDFTPKDSDFVPENFSKLELIQLIVMPRSASSFKTMEDLQDAKIADLQKAGASYVVHDPPFYGGWSGSWPAGSFEIWVSSPYRMSQLYVGTTDFLCILTSGWEVPAGDAYNGIRVRLRDWLVPEASVRRAIAESELLADDVAEIRKEGLAFSALRNPKVWGTWLAVVILGALLRFVGPRTGAPAVVRRLGDSLLLFPTAGAVVGTSFGLAVWTTSWASHNFPLVPAFAFLSLPALFWPLRRRSPADRRGHSAATAVALLAASVLAWMGIVSDWGSTWHRYVPFTSGVFAFFGYGVAGLIRAIFAWEGGEAKGRSAAIGAAILFLSFCAQDASAQAVPIERGAPRAIEGDDWFEARRRLADRGQSPGKFRETAINDLRVMRVPIYKYQRVEITGIWSRDDTNETMPDIFDHQVKPSQWDEPIGIRGPLSELGARLARDVSSLYRDEQAGVSKATQRAVSAAARRAITELQDSDGNPVEVNEIVAHSWGTAIVYNAILTGEIKPPRRLIVAGMPDKDIEKWKALAKYTGTEVIVYADPHDPAARPARIVGKLRSYLADKVGIGGESNPFEAQWKEACSHLACNEFSRVPKPPKFDYGYRGLTHSRLEYYKAMLYNGDLDRNIEALKAAQEEGIRFESERLFQSLVAKERELVARERRARDARFSSDRLLKTKMGDIATRACADPASVEQDELDELPRPSSTFEMFPGPSGLSECALDFYAKMALAILDAPPRVEDVRHLYKPVTPPAAAAPPPAPVVAPVEYNQSYGVPILVAKACDSPGALDEKTFRFYLRSGVIQTTLIEECHRPVAGRSSCASALLQRICVAGSSVAMTRAYLLSLAEAERQRLAPSPSSSDLGDTGKARPEPDDGRHCVQDSDSPRACPQ